MKKTISVFIICLFCIATHAETRELGAGDIIVFNKPSPNTPYYAACSSKKLARKVSAYYHKKKYNKYDRFVSKGLCIQAKYGVRLTVISSDNEYAEVKFNDPSILNNFWISQAWVRKLN